MSHSSLFEERVSGNYDRRSLLEERVSGYNDRHTKLEERGNSNYDRHTLLDERISGNYDRQTLLKERDNYRVCSRSLINERQTNVWQTNVRQTNVWWPPCPEKITSHGNEPADVACVKITNILVMHLGCMIDYKYQGSLPGIATASVDVIAWT